MASIEENICEAIDIILQKAISEATYDKTVQATIVSCIDASVGYYKVKYQDSTFYAYAVDTDTTYSEGTSVYVLIPGNDMTQDKTILGTTKKLGSSYVATVEGDAAYEIVGTNVLTTLQTSSLCSYVERREDNFLYLYLKGSSNNVVEIDETAINEYIANSGYVICGGVVRTALPTEQQYRGNYGIIFALDFLDNTENQIVTRYYVVDVDTMVGNPYKLIYDTRQYGIFEIDSENFIEINYIALFDYGFPYQRTGEPDDIFISDLELSGANRLSDDDLNNYSLTLVTPRGTFFKDALDSDTLLLEAQLRVKGKVVDSDSQSLSFYWGTQDVGVTAQSQYYCNYLGQGWKCLNNYNVIDPVEEYEEAIVEWVPASDTWTITKADVLAREMEYKCAVIYDGNVITKTITIKNFDSEWSLEITSDSGTQFYFDIGYPTLTCSVYNAEVEQSPNDYSYSWAEVTNTGTFISMPETEDLNAEYEADLATLKSLQQQLENEEIFYNASEEQLKEAEQAVNQFDTITRVNKNIIYHLNVSRITSFSNYQCSVYRGNSCIGTTSITLLNTLSVEGAYSLIINNGTHTYKYNESGLSPACSAVESPIDIQALTFTIYDNLGQAIDDDVARHCDIEWTVPSTNSLIEIVSGYDYTEDEENQTTIYKNIMSLSYDIADRYDISKTRNDIYLTVNYKGEALATKTNLTFVKEGEPGTNGTEYSCRIVPNLAYTSGIAPQYLIFTETSNGTYTSNYTPRNSGQYLQVELYHNENRVFNGVTGGQGADNETGDAIDVTWSILANTYYYPDSSYKKAYDPTSLSITSAGVLSFSGYHLVDTAKDTKPWWPAHIVKATIERAGVTYCATFPVITVKLSDDNYTLSPKEGTGFQFATYTSDGQSPQYDNSNPFELTVTKLINGYEEDVSTLTGTEKVGYTWNYDLGQIFYNEEWFEGGYLIERYVSSSEELTENQLALKPVDTYDGQCVTVGIECIVDHSGKEVGRIHIPVHLMLNRYGLASLNGWDGNSIQIDEDGGFILAPQVGAGVKNADNSFTGIVIGKVQESYSTTADVGLVGYSSGQRSIFLDSETGKSVFGTAKRGQITIDPGSSEGEYGTAKIYSGDYFEDGNPMGNATGQGLLIDLNKPEIVWGNGNFSVNSDGYITAKGGGVIAGWTIDDTSFYTGDVKSGTDSVILSAQDITERRTVNDTTDTTLRILVNANFGVNASGHMYAASGTIGSGKTKIELGKDSSGDNSAIYSQKSALTDTAEGFYLGTDGIALGGRKNYDGTYCSAFQVSSEGVMVASSGYIGGRSNGWTIEETALYNSKESFHSNNKGVYIGTDGIALGKTSTDDSGNTFSSFEVSDEGELVAASGYIGNKKNGWTIGTKSLYNGKDSFHSNNTGVYIGTDGIALGKTNTDDSGNTFSCFEVSDDGELVAASGYIGNKKNGWTIGTKSLYNGQSSYNTTSEEGVYLGTDGIGLGAGNFYVTKRGVLFSQSGTIGGWEISTNYLKSSSGSITLNGSGSMSGGTSYSWSIDTNGAATFNNITATGSITATSGTIGGWTVSSNYLKSSSGSITLNGSGSMSGGTSDSWSIDTSGAATFSNITATGNITATSGKIGGWSISGNNLYSSSSSSSTYIYGGNITPGSTSGSGWWIAGDGKAYFQSVTLGSGTTLDENTKIGGQTVNNYTQSVVQSNVTFSSIFGSSGISATGGNAYYMHSASGSTYACYMNTYDLMTSLSFSDVIVPDWNGNNQTIHNITGFYYLSLTFLVANGNSQGHYYL